MRRGFRWLARGLVREEARVGSSGHWGGGTQFGAESAELAWGADVGGREIIARPSGPWVHTCRTWRCGSLKSIRALGGMERMYVQARPPGASRNCIRSASNWLGGLSLAGVSM